MDGVHRCRGVTIMTSTAGEPTTAIAPDTVAVPTPELTSSLAQQHGPDVDPALLARVLRQFEAFGRIAHIGGFEWDIASDSVTWTDELFRIYGREPRSFTPSFDSFIDQIHPDDQDRVRTTVMRALEERSEYVMAERVIRPDGELRYLDTWGEVAVDDEGRPVRLIGVCEDVTGLRTQAQDLAASREELLKFQALVEATNDLVGIATLDGRLLYLNPGGRRLLGLDPRTDVTTSVIADYLDDEGLARSVEVEQRAVLRDGSWTGESWLVDQRDGGRIPVWASSFLMHHPETGEPIAQGTVQRDLREQKRAEERLGRLDDERRQLLAHLVQAQETERQRMAADIHDDTIQVLAAADLRLGLLLSGLRKEGSAEVDNLERVRTSVREAAIRLRNLVFNFDTAAYDQSLWRSLDECASRMLTGTDITWTVRGDRDVDLPVTARVVAYRICHEAVANARNHSGGTHVDIAVESADGGVEISVTDNGVGLDPETIESPPGHFGLSSMRERAAMAGGWWRLERAQPKGTVVRYWIPMPTQS